MYSGDRCIVLLTYYLYINGKRQASLPPLINPTHIKPFIIYYEGQMAGVACSKINIKATPALCEPLSL
jgi:hypothetical protein